MLLRRITKHFTDQNWFAVFLDFLIVVIGILIAFQITEWNEARAEKIRINEQLSSFREELVLSRDDLQNRKNYYNERLESINELRQRLSSHEEFIYADFNKLTVSSLRGRDLGISFRAHEEMVATGLISKVANVSLREILYQWDTMLESIKSFDKVVENSRTTLIVPTAMHATAFANVIQADKRYKNLNTTNRFEIDIEDIRLNREFDNVLAFRYVLADQQLDALINFIEKTEELITALKRVEES